MKIKNYTLKEWVYNLDYRHSTLLQQNFNDRSVLERDCLYGRRYISYLKQELNIEQLTLLIQAISDFLYYDLPVYLEEDGIIKLEQDLLEAGQIESLEDFIEFIKILIRFLYLNGIDYAESVKKENLIEMMGLLFSQLVAHLSFIKLKDRKLHYIQVLDRELFGYDFLAFNNLDELNDLILASDAEINNYKLIIAEKNDERSGTFLLLLPLTIKPDKPNLLLEMEWFEDRLEIPIKIKIWKEE